MCLVLQKLLTNLHGLAQCGPVLCSCSDKHFIILKVWELLMQKLKQASLKARRPKTNTNKKTATDMNTLLRYIEANSMKNEKIESFPASELDHNLSRKQCHIINNLLTSLARAMLGNIGPWLWQYGLSAVSTAVVLCQWEFKVK